MLFEREELDAAGFEVVAAQLDLDRGQLGLVPQRGALFDQLDVRGNLELAEKYMTPAAERLPRNSVVQDHLGDVLAGRGRLADAISAWTRALAGEGDDIDRAAVEKKINDARTRLTR